MTPDTRRLGRPTPADPGARPPLPTRVPARGLRRAVAGALVAAALLPAGASAQRALRYEVSFPDRVHHEAEITLRLAELDPGPLRLRMSRTSPGRYALHEFAKNVYNVRVVDGDGEPLGVRRPDPHEWEVVGHGGAVAVTYTLFADRADGTYAAVDESHAHLNAPATFLWAVGLEERPVEVRFDVPEGSGWKVATQLEPTADPAVYTAPDLQWFLDSPVELSDHYRAEWTVDGARGPQTIRVALHHLGTDDEARAYVEGVRSIVEAERRVWGELPAFDGGTYTFLACYLPWADGDGMEHRNSTVLTSRASLARARVALLGTVAHEFFHAWSVERVRPATLEPFDFSRANTSRELWFAEGFTSYYDDVVLARAGLVDPGAFAARVGSMVDATVNAPGRAHFSAVEMSLQAPFVDAAVSVDPVNRANTFLSYYTWGSAIGLGLDLTLRTRFEGVTLDDLMREMWERHGDPEVPYTVEDVEAALAAVTGDPAFARTFFGRYVRGSEVPDYGALLAAAGIALEPAAPGRAILSRVPLEAAEDGVRVPSSTLEGSPLHEAGVDRTDVILRLDGRAVAHPADVDRIVAARRPGDRVEVTYRSRGRERTVPAVLAEDPRLRATLDPAPSPAARAFLEAWIGR